MLTLEEKHAIYDEAFDLAESILGHEVNRSVIDEYPDLIFDATSTTYGSSCCTAVLTGTQSAFAIPNCCSE